MLWDLFPWNFNEIFYLGRNLFLFIFLIFRYLHANSYLNEYITKIMVILWNNNKPLGNRKIKKFLFSYNT